MHLSCWLWQKKNKEKKKKRATSRGAFYTPKQARGQEGIRRWAQGKGMKWKDEVKWILLCLQGQSNYRSSHGSWGWRPCVTVCTPMPQVCCDLWKEKWRESEATKRQAQDDESTSKMIKERMRNQKAVSKQWRKPWEGHYRGGGKESTMTVPGRPEGEKDRKRLKSWGSAGFRHTWNSLNYHSSFDTLPFYR